MIVSPKYNTTKICNFIPYSFLMIISNFALLQSIIRRKLLNKTFVCVTCVSLLLAPGLLRPQRLTGVILKDIKVIIELGPLGVRSSDVMYIFPRS